MSPRWKAAGLARVMDGRGQYHYVMPETLAGTKTQLRRFHPATALPIEDDRGLTLNRANICTHGRAGFVEVEALGDRWKACPICCPAYQ